MACLIGFPVFHLPVTLTVKIIVLCITAFPVAILAIVGVGGEPLSAFVAHFVKFVLNRRVLLRSDIPEPEQKTKARYIPRKRIKDTTPDEFFDNVSPPKLHRNRKCNSKESQTIEAYLPFDRVENGILHLKDGRYIKILEIEPVNFLLRSVQEQRSIIYSFASYLKISPVKIQVKVLTRKADINRQLQSIQKEIDAELDIRCRRQPKERMMQKLGQQIRINKSRIRDTSDSNSDFDELNDAIRAGYYLKDGLSSNEDFYYLSILVTVTASSLTELNWRIAEVKKLAISQDMDIKVCSYQQETAFHSILPTLSLNKQIYAKSKRNLLTSGIASCYPFVAYEVCDESGVLLGINKQNLSLVMVDNFDTKKYKNANFGVLGATGSGKTFVSLLLALRLRRKRIQTFIISPLKGHEAYRATRNVGGEIIKISPASPVCINIMEIRRVDRSTSEILDGTENTSSSLLSLKIQDLHIFFQLLVPDISYEEKQLLDTACIETYALFGITHDNASLEAPDSPGKYKKMPILEDLYNVLCKRLETRRIANILDRLVHGSAQSFNQQTNVDLDNPFTLLDISELSGDMLVVGFWVALSFVWDRVKEDRTVKKLLFIDELWSLIRESPLLASKVLEIFKVIRGYAGAAGFASQDLGDLFMLENGKFGRGILNACQIKIILYLEIDEARYVQDVLNLSETELMEISHFQRGHALVCANNSHIAVEVRASDLEKELITTDREELQALLDKKKVRKAM